MKEQRRKASELEVIVSDLRSACVDRDPAQVSERVSELFACLKQLRMEEFDADEPRRRLAAGWLLSKCAENLRELEWQMPTKWDEVTQTADLAARCAVQINEPVKA